MNHEQWKCDYCGAVYAEYINGCPKCYIGETGTASSVRLVPVAAAEPQVIRKTMYLLYASTTELGFEWLLYSQTNNPQAIPIPLLSRDGGKTWKQDDTAKDAEIVRLRAERDAALDEGTLMGTEIKAIARERDAALLDRSDLLEQTDAEIARLRAERDASLARIAKMEAAIERALPYVQEAMAVIAARVGSHCCGPESNCDYDCSIRANTSNDLFFIRQALDAAKEAK